MWILVVGFSVTLCLMAYGFSLSKKSIEREAESKKLREAAYKERLEAFGEALRSELKNIELSFRFQVIEREGYGPSLLGTSDMLKSGVRLIIRPDEHNYSAFRIWLDNAPRDERMRPEFRAAHNDLHRAIVMRLENSLELSSVTSCILSIKKIEERGAAATVAALVHALEKYNRVWEGSKDVVHTVSHLYWFIGNSKATIADYQMQMQVQLNRAVSREIASA